MGEGMVFRTLCHFRPLLNMFGTLRTLRTNNINEWNIKIGPLVQISAENRYVAFLCAPCTIIVIHCALCNNNHIFSSPSSSILTVPLKSRWGDFLGLPPKPPGTHQCNHWFDIVTILWYFNQPALCYYKLPCPIPILDNTLPGNCNVCRQRISMMPQKIPWVGTKVQNIIKYF